MTETNRSMKAIIVGAGPVGCLVAIALRSRGIEVELYDKGSDIRLLPPGKGHSFNLTLTQRGLDSLDERVTDLLYANGVPLPQRVIHHTDGSLSYQPYGPSAEHNLLSIPRGMLHRTLLDEADRVGARLFFDYTCVRVNPVAARAHFAVDGTEVHHSEADIVIGCDGANSIVRHEMSRRGARMQLSQDYIDHGFIELEMPPDVNGRHALMEALRDRRQPASQEHGLHVWPRGEFMLLAQPNVDNSYTTSLFMPLRRDAPEEQDFHGLRTPEDVTALFERHFPDITHLLPKLTTDFFAAPPASLKTVKVHPYHFGRTVLIGDSSHTMVPFYGQGINCSFEDVRQFLAILDHNLATFSGDGAIQRSVSEFTETRKGPGDAIAELSLLNLQELTSRTGDSAYHTRKRLERELHQNAPDKFIPLYHMVAFTEIPYDEVVERHQQQSAALDELCGRFDMATEADRIIESYTAVDHFDGLASLLSTPSGSELELARDQMREMLDAVTDRIMDYQDRMSGGGYPASYLQDSEPADYDEGRRASALLREDDIPRVGSDLDSLLSDIFERVITNGMVHPHPGMLSHVPSGGLFQAAVGEFIARILNRFVGVWAATPGFTQIESNVIRWFCTMLGYGEGSFGYLTTGGSIANFMGVRCAVDNSGDTGGRLATVYVSDQGHFSVEKAAKLAGVDPCRVRTIGTDDDYTMDVDQLRDRVEQDRGRGLIPTLVVATAGTTNTGAVDDLRRISEFCRQQGVWLHTDACFGGFFGITERGGKLLAGIEESDSIAVDAHKSLFLPHGTSALLVRDRTNLRAAFEVPGASYIPELTDDPEYVDFCNYGPELTREVRGLTAWLPIKMHGIDAFADTLDQKLDLAERLSACLATFEELEVVARERTHLPVINFRVRAATPEESAERTEQLCKLIRARANVYVTTTRLPREGLVIRACVMHHRTGPLIVDQLLEDVRGSLKEMTQEALSHDIH
ncbi:glutamate/tyrosine decarboxylase-like PLP-dependent enzyme/2-polyprenyl-6-methoxyphenol hydroxylase-like FAD-dependent oxidoreductase [Actinopolyspora lacussalsi]|nr:glutamate/tyrosine decarboxylase-like PLP-dependent enzyme/2-polyprenyl-6-methoxyphenol hydroxylase-like FAD-dependent oxidoreductase [Actinopolyspora lacussalsi]